MKFYRFLVFLLLSISGTVVHAEAPLTIFAAASLSDVMTRIGEAYTTRTGTQVVFSFAGTGTLARQIEAGASADVFVSADQAWMDYVRDREVVQPDTIRIVATNALVLAGQTGSAPVELTAAALADRLGNGRLAIADPDTVPAGRYGKSALEALGLWSAVSGRLAPMENVRVALTTVARGDTPLGLVYATDAAIEPDVDVVARFPTDSHAPIVYLAATTRSESGTAADRFLAFLAEPRARMIWLSLEFGIPDGG